MKFASLGSGSKGNATLVASGDQLLLIDCGFSLKQLEARMQLLDLTPAQITGILVTHEHSDHASGVGVLSRRFKLPVWATRGTLSHKLLNKLAQAEVICSHSEFTIGEITVLPVPVPHDAAEPVQYVFQANNKKLGLLTDTGNWTPYILQSLNKCDGLLLEFNHDLKMLNQGPYPPRLKQRVAGLFGHLNNQQALDILQQLDLSKLQHLVAGHISQENNSPTQVAEMLQQQFGQRGFDITIASQGEGFGWKHIN
ncbi:MBL fold metallo-hydrolase [Pelagibaculum spongiae]|uniref:MBL fold metallo-hydrolase n=1 Tax=Pelagibaculum spongiae TaxID=2080658 RepID=A0A2V1H0W5_9GAMM|nr:MBL fold metallo-hydrolase [Pelagibaculum spongiae]PVZ69662.1 MBL fold metallo-hydrolase [Pelagibaculum spongiae]